MTLCLYGLYERRPGLPAEPFYIGIGTQKRPKRHLYEAKKGIHYNAGVQEVCNEHFALGLIPEIRVLAILPSRAYAAETEKKAIKVFGRRGIDEHGTLCNLATGGQGPDSELMKRPEVVAKFRESLRKSDEASPARREAISRSMKERYAQNPALKDSVRKTLAATRDAIESDPARRAKWAASMRGKPKTASPASAAARRYACKRMNEERLKLVGRPLSDAQQRANAANITAAQQIANSATALAKRADYMREENARTWSDPSKRESRIAAIKARSERMSEASKGYWSDESNRAARGEAMRARWADPKVKAARIEKMKAAWVVRRNNRSKQA